MPASDTLHSYWQRCAASRGLRTGGRPRIVTTCVPGIRSFHIRHSRAKSREAPVADPVHVIFYRVLQPGVVEIVRVLHDRMEPLEHVGSRS